MAVRSEMILIAQLANMSTEGNKQKPASLTGRTRKQGSKHRRNDNQPRHGKAIAELGFDFGFWVLANSLAVVWVSTLVSVIFHWQVFLG